MVSFTLPQVFEFLTILTRDVQKKIVSATSAGHLIVRLLLFCLLGLTACRTAAPLPKIDFSEQGWTVHQGQALWRTGARSPEIAGDLLLATNTDGRMLVQFNKTPFPMIVAQTATGRWQIESPSQNKRHTGRGAPPGRLIWFQLPRALSGSTLPHAWSWHRSLNNWRLENTATGESLEGYLSP
jgi:hypothetical protein